MVTSRRLPLDQQILMAFKLAHDKGELDVAEHLLCALECLCAEARPRIAVDEALMIVSGGVSLRS